MNDYPPLSQIGLNADDIHALVTVHERVIHEEPTGNDFGVKVLQTIQTDAMLHGVPIRFTWRREIV